MKILLAGTILAGSSLLFGTLAPGLFRKVLGWTGARGMIHRGTNLMALMENDCGSFFKLWDDCVREHVFTGGSWQIGSHFYSKIVLTPLIMDFGYKNMTEPGLHYGKKPTAKPVVEQVTDIFTGIRDFVGERGDGLLEIYPFLGVNTANYSLAGLTKMMEKYFGAYCGYHSDLQARLGQFDGDIDSMGSNFFAGVKVYPPLGFDPWPEDAAEREKVEYLYDFCSRRRIPLTTHCSPGGFRVVETKEALLYTSPDRWEKVLRSYPDLKLNFGHLGGEERFGAWGEKIISLILEYENVYGDFSCRGFNDRYYKTLSCILDRQSVGDKGKLFRRILFGSDFMINLLWMDSYCQYLDIFAKTPFFTPDMKDIFCRINPERFLFV